jgi:hypothetical protein
MPTVNLPEIPDVPQTDDWDQYNFNRAIKEILETLLGRLGSNTSLVDYMELTRKLKSGEGSPEGVVDADVGTIYLRFEGSTSTTLYVKETGGSGSTGWVAK